MSKSTSVSRRSFLKGLTASALGAAALTACSAPASSGAAAASGGTAAGEGGPLCRHHPLECHL